MKYIVTFTFLLLVGLIVSGNANLVMARSLTVGEFSNCVRWDMDLAESEDDVDDLFNRRESMVRQINGMYNGPSRTSLVRAVRNLDASLDDAESSVGRLQRQLRRNCTDVKASYETFKEACSNRYKLRQKYCSSWDEHATKLKTENNW